MDELSIWMSWSFPSDGNEISISIPVTQHLYVTGRGRLAIDGLVLDGLREVSTMTSVPMTCLDLE